MVENQREEHLPYPRRWSWWACQTIVWLVFGLVSFRLVSLGSLLLVGWANRSGVLMSRSPSQYDQKIQFDLGRSFAEFLHNNWLDWHIEMVWKVTIPISCKLSSSPSNHAWLPRVMFLKWPIYQLRVEQKFVDHALRPLVNSWNTFIDHRGCWSTTAWCIFEVSSGIVESSYPLQNSAIWWSRVTLDICQLFSYFCCD